MKTLCGSLFRWFCLAILAFPALAAAQQLQPVKLPSPQTTDGMPLMQVLKARHSTREFSSRKLPLPVLSDLLWPSLG
jgi:hypothetical protein